MASSPKPLFIYGTLRDPDVLQALLLRELLPHQRANAHALGFAAVHYPGRPYPGLVAAPGGNAPGLLLHGLTPGELTLLDAFEGEEYRRDTIEVLTGSASALAEVYLPVIAIGPDATPWTLERWTVLHKPAVLDAERSSARALRERLAGTLPQ